MSIQVKGVIEHKDIGVGVWALVADSGETYELKDAPPDLLQPNLKAQVTGLIREDVMTLAMIGPVLEVNTFQVIN
jgi:hypothetical protein